jgi:hypothetical protein
VFLSSFLSVLSAHTFPYLARARARDTTKCACLSCVRPCRATTDAPRRAIARRRLHRTAPYHTRHTTARHASSARTPSAVLVQPVARANNFNLHDIHVRDACRMGATLVKVKGAWRREHVDQARSHACTDSTCGAPQLNRLTEHANRELAQ